MTTTTVMNESNNNTGNTGNTAAKTQQIVTDTTVVIYHANCSDGMAAAAMVDKYSPADEQLMYIPMRYDTPCPYMFTDCTLYIVDFMLPIMELTALGAVNKKIIVLDHHIKTMQLLDAESSIAKYPQLGMFAETVVYFIAHNVSVIFDNNHSGAMLAWKYFHTDEIDTCPRVIEYVDDYDRWVHALPDSHAVVTALYTLGKTLSQWRENDYFGGVTQTYHIERLIIAGSWINRYRDDLVDTYVKRAQTIKFENYRVLCVNAPAAITSMLGHRLASEPTVPFAMMWEYAHSKVIVSLRSNAEHGIDVNEIAKRYGGGGHRNAAGFSLPTIAGFAQILANIED